ncbi:helix-turn-helix domain-containing protein [Caulobacter sp. LARHSG274]
MRARRKALGLSQTQLADSVRITFQQLQKYERGANRVSASKLYGIAMTLQTSVAWFFEGLVVLDTDAATGDPAVDERRVQIMQRFMASPEGVELATLLLQLPHGQRRQIVSLVKALGEGEAVGAEA